MASMRLLSWKLVLALELLLLAAFSAARADVINVNSTGALSAALAVAKGGDVIRLGTGQYGNFRLAGKQNQPLIYSPPLTIASADMKAPSVFNSVALKYVSGLHFEGLSFNLNVPAGTPLWASPFSVADSDTIIFDNSVFIGAPARGVSPRDDGYGNGRGLVVMNSKNITISKNKFVSWNRAGVFGGVAGLQVSGNEVMGSSSDGFDFNQVQDVIIAGNHFHDFSMAPQSGAHPDMIQFWTSGTKLPSVNVKIVDNFLDIGSGTNSQAIFMRNEVVDQGKAGPEMYYRNFVVANNVVVNRHLHGITVGETDGLVIEHNTVILKQAPDLPKDTMLPSINVSGNAVNVRVAKNIAAAFGWGKAKPPAAWDVEDNYLVQYERKAAANYAGKALLNALGYTTAERQDFMIATDGPLRDRDIGAGPVREP